MQQRFAGLFQLDYDLLLYDLTSSYFEGLAEENDLARRGYSRDHRSDCQQIVLALVVTREGFPLAPITPCPATPRTCRRCVASSVKSKRASAQSQRVWVMDRGMISADTLSVLNEPAAAICSPPRRHELTCFKPNWRNPAGSVCPIIPASKSNPWTRDGVHYLLAAAATARRKKRAMPPPPTPRP